MDISPDKQNIDRVFSNTPYHIDFYQRDYRWTDEPVRRLLDDVFYKFREEYQRSSALDPGKETISRYPWYYLNTYVTNVVDGRVYVVDGQQRLTTLSLILIGLRHLAISFGSKLRGWIEGKIAGQSGFEQEFWMNHVGHRITQQGLYDGLDLDSIPITSGTTARNMVANYRVVRTWLQADLSNQHRFETFVFYFLHRLVLVNMAVEQTDVSMVFEVINDRGVRLRPHEILKGKLLGQIDKVELDKGKYHELWERQAAAINKFQEDEFDDFFRFFLKAKFSPTRNDGQRFDGDYHRAMFTVEMDAKLGLGHDATAVKKFLHGEFTYYSALYARLLAAYHTQDPAFPHLFHNRLLDLNAPFLLILSACVLDDKEEDAKIGMISREIDRYFSLLQLQNAYDSNAFADSLYKISMDIRGQGVTTFRPAFDNQLATAVADSRNDPKAAVWSYPAFAQTGINLNSRFIRYFLGRIDGFLAENIQQNPRHPLADLVWKTGAVNGFHIEHILSHNAENLTHFGGDAERFEQERNRLGGLLLLKGRANISSGNEPYTEKLGTYATTLFWNETLRADSYKTNLDVRDLKARYQLDLQPYSEFGPEELEARHRLLFDLSTIIWG